MAMKRVLDLSPERIEAIRMNDPDLAVLEEGALAKSLAYWEELDGCRNQDCTCSCRCRGK